MQPPRRAEGGTQGETSFPLEAQAFPEGNACAFMSYLVSPQDAENHGLFENDPGKEILRNIAVILATPLGSVPFYRDFGLDQSFLDKPKPVAEVMMVVPVREAIERWEPRAEFVELTVSDDPSNPGKLIPVVEVEIHAAQS